MDVFSESYAEARARFRARAGALGGVLTAHENTAVRGPGGERLTTDVARFGPPGAPRLLLAIAGTHGIEGFCGSAALLAWLESGAPALPAGSAVVMVHAINPWGFAHRSRTTENNVDLNRNFVDHTGDAPANPVYAELHAALCPDTWDAAAVAAAKDAVAAFVARNGAAMLSDYLRRGQYTHPSGLNYGGRAREWSNRIMEMIVATEAAGAERVAFIDWHTGLGQRGEDFFICFNDKGTPEFAQCVRWWGAAKVDREKAFEGEDRPRYTGLVFHGTAQFLGGRPMAGAVIEFGTRTGVEMREAVRGDRWLKFACPDRTAPAARALEADIFEAFCPHDDAWRRTVVAASRRIHAEALAGLGGWG
ncbi:MAG: M14 family metallopeptidase [Alphaproteobacteria bacterium]|nr:M14 family metallopeptidase [Alphaproteobacteria bacterium]